MRLWIYYTGALLRNVLFNTTDKKQFMNVFAKTNTNEKKHLYNYSFNALLKSRRGAEILLC